MAALAEVRHLAKLPALPRLTVVTLLAVAALYVPTFCKLFTFGWDNADYSHGPLILAAFLWLMWRKREAIAQGSPLAEWNAGAGSPLPEGEGQGGGTLSAAAEGPHPHPNPPLEEEGAVDGGAIFNIMSILSLLFGVACYATGSVHGSMAIESFSMVPVFVGASGFLLGKRALKEFLFPLAFLLFLVPPPLILTDMLTAPLKMLVATAAAWLLKSIGYLVTRHGATILMSDYSITVGDPCSGMRSLIALTSVGALYAHLLQSSKLKKGILFLSTVPISVMANIVRLMMLCLITYYWGEAAAEGFLHKFSGFVLFVVSLVSLFLLDVAMHRRAARER